MERKADILYVDDELINTQVFEITFSPEYNIFVALSGAEGIEILKQNPEIRFIISDMKMPYMNGLEFIKEVKKINPSLPCMILSGYQQNIEIDEALMNHLIIDYLIKPFNKSEIIRLINKYILE